jgi:hypothetical protein
MRQGGQSRDALDAISAIATFEPGMYEIVEEFRPGSEADTASRI